MRPCRLLVLPLLTACSQPTLQSPASQDRIQAIATADTRDRYRSIPDLLPSLSSSDALVRQQAQRALVDRTGTTRGYEWSDPPADRDRAIANWRQWCIDQGLAPKEPTP